MVQLLYLTNPLGEKREANCAAMYACLHWSERQACYMGDPPLGKILIVVNSQYLLGELVKSLHDSTLLKFKETE